MNMRSKIRSLEKVLATFPKKWDGKAAILEMKNEGYSHWRQTEWIGFYFQYLCDRNLIKAGMSIPGTKFGRAEFDGKLGVDWDFKAHPIFNKDGKEVTDLIANDMEATYATIKMNGQTGLIVVQGMATFDDAEKMSFREWHKGLKGGDSAYSLANAKRGAGKRIYKTAFEIKYIDLYLIDGEDIEKQSRFQKGMRNSNGNPRREKLKIDLTTIFPVSRIEF